MTNQEKAKELQYKLKIDQLKRGLAQEKTEFMKYRVRHRQFLNRLTILLELPQQADEDDVLQELEKVVKNLKEAL